jgi:hypothetical protein
VMPRSSHMSERIAIALETTATPPAVQQLQSARLKGTEGREPHRPPRRPFL